MKRDGECTFSWPHWSLVTGIKAPVKNISGFMHARRLAGYVEIDTY
jgi:hypothetical protein